MNCYYMKLHYVYSKDYAAGSLCKYIYYAYMCNCQQQQSRY